MRLRPHDGVAGSPPTDGGARSRSSMRAAPKPTSSTPSIHPPQRIGDEERNVQRQAFAGMLWTQAELPLRRRRLARRRRSRACRRRRSGSTGATATGAISTRCASSRCRTSGSTHGSRRGTSRFTRSSFALIDADVRQGAALADALRAVPASQRPDPRVRMGVLRSQSARAGVGGLARLQHGPHPQRQAPTWRSSRSASTSCC